MALTKMEGKYRPIAVGELFARLAGKLAMRKVTSAAAALLAYAKAGRRRGKRRKAHRALAAAYADSTRAAGTRCSCSTSPTRSTAGTVQVGCVYWKSSPRSAPCGA